MSSPENTISKVGPYGVDVTWCQYVSGGIGVLVNLSLSPEEAQQVRDYVQREGRSLNLLAKEALLVALTLALIDDA